MRLIKDGDDWLSIMLLKANEDSWKLATIVIILTQDLPFMSAIYVAELYIFFLIPKLNYFVI